MLVHISGMGFILLLFWNGLLEMESLDRKLKRCDYFEVTFYLSYSTSSVRYTVHLIGYHSSYTNLE